MFIQLFYHKIKKYAIKNNKTEMFVFGIFKSKNVYVILVKVLIKIIEKFVKNDIIK